MSANTGDKWEGTRLLRQRLQATRPTAGLGPRDLISPGLPPLPACPPFPPIAAAAEAISRPWEDRPGTNY